MANDYYGPVDDSVLYDQANHISTTIWNGGLREKLTIRQSTSNLGEWNLHDYQVHLLRQWGFGMFVNPKSVMQNDVSLITALVERWRPETNTFHFTFGEMTVIPSTCSPRILSTSTRASLHFSTLSLCLALCFSSVSP